MCVRTMCATTASNMKLVSSSDVVSTDAPASTKRLRRKNIQIPEGSLLNVNVHDAVDRVKAYSTARFDATVNVAINLGLDPRKPNQSIKGIARLPNGTGKKVRIAVFATGPEAEAAISAGADLVGSTDLIARIQAGEIPFDTAIATPEMMPLLSKVGKILGPRGLMPNPKMGTVTRDVTRAVKLAREGAVQFRVEKQGIVHAGIGKVSFSKEALLENIRSFMVAISDSKPEGLKGKYLLDAHIQATMGPSIHIDLPTVDPSNARFMLDLKLKKSE